jgi:uncharacterized protein YegP (UPF0339 family)
VSKIIDASNSTLPSYLKSLDAWAKYIDELNIPYNSYHAGNTLAAQHGQIELAGQEYIDYTPATINTTTKSAKGKWKVEKDENGYSARLYANNGQLMIATEGVSSRATAEKAVENVKKHSAAGNFIIDKDKFGRFYYKLRNAQKSVICIGEAYDKLDSCTSALESVRRFAETAVYGDEE